MILGIVGSRGFSDYEKLQFVLMSVKSPIDMIVSGGAKGADSLARRYALENDIPLEEFLPDWNKHGRSAGYKRNQDIVRHSEGVIAFWDGQSKGTLHSINIAKEMGIPVYVVRFNSKEN